MSISLEDLALCAYSLCEDDFSVVGEYTDCVPEALHTLYSIANTLGIKIRFSTISALINYVTEFNRLKEDEVEEILVLLKNIVQGDSIPQASKTLLRILLKRDINISRNEQDIAEIAIAALYASFVKTTSELQYQPQLLGVSSPSLTPTVMTTAT